MPRKQETFKVYVRAVGKNDYLVAVRNGRMQLFEVIASAEYWAMDDDDEQLERLVESLEE